ncbi:GNAT family N-acetyltransferase [Paenibacillus senegalimassiliensis]|uniref:GNAT family N-acetyltransferase n=1 Tax=Paenibacillus senegalimassiliensis TaxID=1737426 RepID=UPI00073E34FA|nr:GNAT family protein [Paenibacillus senegalimassiliensis]
MINLDTERLLIRNFQSNDWKDLHDYLSIEEVLKYEPGNVCDEVECKQMALERSQNDIFMAVVLRETHNMVGHIYFNQIKPDEFLTWGLGYIFNPKYYGNGYATEASRRVLQYGFEVLKAHRVIAMCNPENHSSWRLLERLPMRREGHHMKKAFFYRDNEGQPVWHDAYQYAILAEEWVSE